MSLTIDGRMVQVMERGKGPPVLYLHGFADIHAATVDWQPFHLQASEFCRLIAPAHPGCAGSTEDELIDTIEDVVFHYLQVLDALGLERVCLAGSSMGGWIAAELAVRIPERVTGLALFGAVGLMLPDDPIGDLFMMVQPNNITSLADFRRMLFRSAEAPEALALFPDGQTTAEREILRYKMFRLASRVGFSPPYFYHPRLAERLPRYCGPALVVTGAEDGFVPPAHARLYAARLAGARLHVVADAGNSVILEQAAQATELLKSLVQG